MTTRIAIRRPDDWHLHVRDGEMLKAVLPYTAQHFGRAILMPNLVPPIRTANEAAAYRERVRAALPKGSRFTPLMTCYLTDETDPDDVERGFRDGVFAAVKLYPANATTNSAVGVTDYVKITRVLERMEKIGMPFLMHGEEVGADIDIFDREAVFIDRRLSKFVKQFPGLRMTMEHLSSKDGADFVKSAAPQVGATITPYHLSLTRTDWLGAGTKPMMYAMPVIKTAGDRAALRKAATSGEPCYFLGTDSAPHPFARKVAIGGVPGIFNAPVALRPTPGSSRKKARSTSLKRLRRSMDRSIIACRRTKIRSCWKRRRGRRRRGQSRRAGRAHAALSRRRDHRVAGSGGVRRGNNDGRLRRQERYRYADGKDAHRS